MLDERWSEEAEEIGQTLHRILEKECTHEVVRQAEEATDGRSHALELQLEEFGLRDLEGPPDWYARIAYELGWSLAPTAHVEEMAVQALFGRAGVVLGLDSWVPAASEFVAILREDGVYLEQLSGAPKRTAAGDFLVRHQTTGEGEKLGDVQLADRLRRFGLMCSSARMIGAGQALLRYGVDYACEREQFGQPIGAYQAIANRLTEASTLLDGAELLLRKTAFTATAEAGGDGAPMDHFTTMLWAQSVDAARNVAMNVHQAFGGNGFTLEYNVQLFSRRLRSWANRGPRSGPMLAELARTLLTAGGCEDLQLLWHHEQGLPLPRWAQEADSITLS